MVHGLVQTFHHPDGKNGRQILGVPVILASRAALRHDLQRPGTAPEFHASFNELPCQLRQQDGCDRIGDQQGFHGVADPVTLGLGIQRDADRFLQIGPVVDVHMADAIQMLDDRDA